MTGIPPNAGISAAQQICLVSIAYVPESMQCTPALALTEVGFQVSPLRLPYMSDNTSY